MNFHLYYYATSLIEVPLPLKESGPSLRHGLTAVSHSNEPIDLVQTSKCDASRMPHT